MSDYFKKTEYLSNSGLTQFGSEIGVLPIFDSDPYDAFRLGTLFDILATEPSRIDRLNRKIIGTEYSFSEYELIENEKMLVKLNTHSIYKLIISLNPDFQTEIYNDKFSFDGLPPLKFKAKLDLFLKNWVIDLKTTNATSQNQFETSCEMFGYYRQMILYMLLTESKKSTIIAVSKIKPYKIFVVNFDEKHEAYDRNYKMIGDLIKKYILLR